MILVTAISAPDYGDDMTVINVTDDIVKQFKKHGEKEYPHECCGFILGSFKDKESMGIEYVPAPNTKEENRERRFLIDQWRTKKQKMKQMKEVYLSLVLFILILIIQTNHQNLIGNMHGQDLVILSSLYKKEMQRATDLGN